ncbi:MAG TPA: hypothetical protein VFS43_38445 [Polyangiaceae bacterium]|nr:hypothetical protein [Polyangiaceae bacterium]
MPATLTSAVARAENAVDLALSADVRAQDAASPHDALNPACWSLAGPGSPTVVRVDARKADGAPDRARAFRLTVLPSLAPGGAYAVAPAPALKDPAGASAATTAFAVLAPGRAPLAGPAPGEPAADVLLPALAGPDGGPRLAGELEALRARLETLAQTRLGAFTHLPGFGHELEPKRPFTAARLAREAARLAAAVRADPDVLRASVSVRAAEAPGLLEVEVRAEPRFGGPPLDVAARVVAGPGP